MPEIEQRSCRQDRALAVPRTSARRRSETTAATAVRRRAAHVRVHDRACPVARLLARLPTATADETATAAPLTAGADVDIASHKSGTTAEVQQDDKREAFHAAEAQAQFHAVQR